MVPRERVAGDRAGSAEPSHLVRGARPLLLRRAIHGHSQIEMQSVALGSGTCSRHSRGATPVGSCSHAAPISSSSSSANCANHSARVGNGGDGECPSRTTAATRVTRSRGLAPRPVAVADYPRQVPALRVRPHVVKQQVVLGRLEYEQPDEAAARFGHRGACGAGYRDLAGAHRCGSGSASCCVEQPSNRHSEWRISVR